jgi:hypothetical protein
MIKKTSFIVLLLTAISASFLRLSRTSSFFEASFYLINADIFHHKPNQHPGATLLERFQGSQQDEICFLSPEALQSSFFSLCKN